MTYWDTSALVKLYVPERDSADFLKLVASLFEGRSHILEPFNFRVDLRQLILKVNIISPSVGGDQEKFIFIEGAFNADVTFTGKLPGNCSGVGHVAADERTRG